MSRRVFRWRVRLSEGHAVRVAITRYEIGGVEACSSAVDDSGGAVLCDLKWNGPVVPMGARWMNESRRRVSLFSSRIDSLARRLATAFQCSARPALLAVDIVARRPVSCSVSMALAIRWSRPASRLTPVTFTSIFTIALALVRWRWQRGPIAVVAEHFELPSRWRAVAPASSPSERLGIRAAEVRRCSNGVVRPLIDVVLSVQRLPPRHSQVLLTVFQPEWGADTSQSTEVGRDRIGRGRCRCTCHISLYARSRFVGCHSIR